MMGTAGLLKNPMFGSCSPEAHPAGERNYKLAPSLPVKAYRLLPARNIIIHYCASLAGCAPGQQLHSALFSLINSDNGGISLCQASTDTAYAVTAPPAAQLIHHRH
jgi:hypothetical protein